MPSFSTSAAARIRQPAYWHRHLDLAGAWLSLGCAAHCMVLPVLLALVPTAMLALRSFRHPAHGAMTLLLELSRWEWLFAATASGMALASTCAGAARHGRRLGPMLAGAGSVALLGASAYAPLKEALLWHGAVAAVGGLLLASAHLYNRVALRRTAPGLAG